MGEHTRVQQKINFLHLFKVFQRKIAIHFLITTVKTIFWNLLLLQIFHNLWDSRGNISDYKSLLPRSSFFRRLFSSLGKEEFIFLGICLVVFHVFLCYFDNLQEEELKIRGGNYTKNLLLDKFRRLTFEEKNVRKEEVSALIELDSGEVGFYWEHLPNHVYHSILAIVLLIGGYWKSLWKMEAREFTFSFLWIILVNIASYYLTNLVLKNEKKYKKELSEEIAIINKEKDKGILIEGMGLTSRYRIQQRKTTKANEKLLLSFNKVKALSRTIPIDLLIDIFPFLLLFLSKNFVGKNLIILWFVFENFSAIFKCLRDYSDYASSLARINAFLELPEKDDNLQGIKLNEEVKFVNFQNVYYSYSGSSNLVLNNYSNSFTREQINRLEGENGTGKSTIIYLVLGMLEPNKGKIMIETATSQTYNLHSDINLKHWRENNTIYCSHENLIEEGSTGQKQLANINNTLAAKKEAQIFIFDEATNALDKRNQKEIEEKLQKLLAKGGIIIYTKH